MKNNKKPQDKSEIKLFFFSKQLIISTLDNLIHYQRSKEDKTKPTSRK